MHYTERNAAGRTLTATVLLLSGLSALSLLLLLCLRCSAGKTSQVYTLLRGGDCTEVPGNARLCGLGASEELLLYVLEGALVQAAVALVLEPGLLRHVRTDRRTGLCVILHYRCCHSAAVMARALLGRETTHSECRLLVVGAHEGYQRAQRLGALHHRHSAAPLRRRGKLAVTLAPGQVDVGLVAETAEGLGCGAAVPGVQRMRLVEQPKEGVAVHWTDSVVDMIFWV